MQKQRLPAITLQAFVNGEWRTRHAFETENAMVYAGTLSRDALIELAKQRLQQWHSTGNSLETLRVTQ
jgi:hypothetical protein